MTEPTDTDTAASGTLDPRFIAAVDLIGRTGCKQFQIRWSDDEEPLLWMAVATYQRKGRDHHFVGAGLDPVAAVFRLCDDLVDGGVCAHCHRPTGFHETHEAMPLGQAICWYQYDPERNTFRRSCE